MRLHTMPNSTWLYVSAKLRHVFGLHHADNLHSFLSATPLTHDDYAEGCNFEVCCDVMAGGWEQRHSHWGDPL